MSKKIWTTIIIILILVGITYLLLGLKNNTTENQGIVAGDNNSLVVGLQNPTSVAVLIREASLTEPGFIVIHKDNNGVAGEVVAVSELLHPDRYQNISIVMDFQAGEAYIAMLHADNGNGRFNPETDLPMKNMDNQTVMASFKISDTPFVEGEFDEKG